MNVLALNAGSSSLKYKLFGPAASSDAGLPEQPLIEGSEDHSGTADIVAAAEKILDRCYSLGVDAIGHRFVHGGPSFFEPTKITSQTLEVLRKLEPLDPLHNPAEVALVDAGMRICPQIPEVAVFDTAFHHTLPDVAWNYAIPHDTGSKYQLRRYGFHGISHSYVSKELLKAAEIETDGSKVITCHLGSGSSICAVKDGKSIDTSMGMTPLEGLVMGTRSGDIDPGLLLYLMQQHGFSPSDLNDMLNNKGGLAGVSGQTSDLRILEQSAAAGDGRSLLAVELFAYRAAKYIGAYAVALEGLDAIAFTGGIGEHSPEMRGRICRRLTFLGIDLNREVNSEALGRSAVEIGKPAARVKTWVIPTNEELALARETAEVVG